MANKTKHLFGEHSFLTKAQTHEYCSNVLTSQPRLAFLEPRKSRHICCQICAPVSTFNSEQSSANPWAKSCKSNNYRLSSNIYKTTKTPSNICPVLSSSTSNASWLRIPDVREQYPHFQSLLAFPQYFLHARYRQTLINRTKASNHYTMAIHSRCTPLKMQTMHNTGA